MLAVNAVTLQRIFGVGFNGVKANWRRSTLRFLLNVRNIREFCAATILAR
jgi:hypothetical protein